MGFEAWREARLAASMARNIGLPEYVTPIELREVIETSGRLIGLGDFRPTYGRFGLVGFEVRQG